MKYLIIFSIVMLTGCGHVIMFDNVCRSDVPKVPIQDKQEMRKMRTRPSRIPDSR